MYWIVVNIHLVKINMNDWSFLDDNMNTDILSCLILNHFALMDYCWCCQAVTGRVSYAINAAVRGVKLHDLYIWKKSTYGILFDIFKL